MNNKLFLIDGCNFVDYPKGGQLSFFTQLLEVFPDNYFRLIGVTTDASTKIGKWQVKTINGKCYDFIPLYYTKNRSAKGLIPGRLKFFLALFKYRNRLFNKIEINHLFTHSPETLLALKLNKNNIKVLHFMHGVENPLSMARFKWAIIFSSLFWKLYLKKLLQADHVVATADDSHIKRFQLENNFPKNIVSFPNRFDDDIFRPLEYKKPATPTFIYCGRINQVKGWELLIQSFNYYLKSFGEARLIIVGDGEDRGKLEELVKQLDIKNNVFITGFLDKNEIADWLNKAHVFLLTSHREGWPIAMIEALACGLPVVSTNVSAVSQMILEGKNGFVINEYDAEIFAQTMHKTLSLVSPNPVSLRLSKNYLQSNLKVDLLKLFPEFFNN